MIHNQLGGGGSAINGVLQQYQVNTGETISAGDFVEIVGGNVSSYNTTIHGIAKSAGVGGDTISVYVPD